MSLGDSIVNSVFGTNIHTIKVNAGQLAAVINDAFIRKATNREELDKIERTVRGSKLMFHRMDSEDGKFHLHVSYFERGLTEHRYVFVKNYETEEVFEWRGLSLSPLKKAVEPYLLHARMNPTPSIPFNPTDFSENGRGEDTTSKSRENYVAEIDEAEEMRMAKMIIQQEYDRHSSHSSDNIKSDIEQLKELHEMLETGTISEQEFIRRQENILQNM